MLKQLKKTSLEEEAGLVVGNEFTWHHCRGSRLLWKPHRYPSEFYQAGT